MIIKPTSDKFVSERFGLCDGAETTGGHLLSIKFHRLLGDIEPLLNYGRKFSDSTAFLSEHALCPGGHDDDFRLGWRDAHLHAGVAILGQLPSEELIQFRLEHSVSDELQCLVEVMF